MSRNDTYLSLCLEQASLSPLHFRHGCIVVRGGKVIGKGYNDYRSGYNGGAETTGQLSSAVYSQGVITNKSKQKNSKSPYPLAGSGHEVSSKSKSTKNYVAFDSQNHALGTGGGSLANTPLSMHSEMMAINSALSLSSAIACQGTARSTQWLQKPCFKLPGRSKRQTRLQHLKAYADAVCADEQEQKTTSSSPLQHYREDYYSVEKEKAEEKNESKRQNTVHSNVHHHAQINYLNFQKAKSETSMRLTSDNNEKHPNGYLYGIQNSTQYHHHSGHKKAQNVTHPQQQRQKTSALVLPQNRILSKSHQVAERIKDPRLNGADLYVARLGRIGKVNRYECGCLHDKAESVNETTTAGESREGVTVDSSPAPRMQPLTGSLHDELRFPTPRKPSRAGPKAEPAAQQAIATYSRPCYRCISYMHSAGIKRVFWTNAHGEWEGEKVRELVDALENPKSPDSHGSTRSSGDESIYVTKSEVLMKGLR